MNQHIMNNSIPARSLIQAKRNLVAVNSSRNLLTIYNCLDDEENLLCGYCLTTSRECQIHFKNFFFFLVMRAKKKICFHFVTYTWKFYKKRYIVSYHTQTCTL